MSRIISQQLLVSLVFAFVLTACQGTRIRGINTYSNSISEQLPSSCERGIQAFRNVVDQDGVTNAGAPALPFYPLLHSNRFLHSLSHSAASSGEVSQWALLLAELAIKTRATENKNLSTPWSNSSLKELADCSRSFARESQYEKIRSAVLSTVQQSEFLAHYLQSRQALGALAVLRPFLKQRILALHADERRWFLEEESFTRPIHYEIDAAPTVSGSVASSVVDWMKAGYASNELALPLLQESELDSLFVEHAPKLQIEFADDNDMIGAVEWVDNQFSISDANPTVYTLSSMTQFEGRKLLQLNYVFWFAARKPTTLIDLYSGIVDSIIWRVTLDEDGQVLLYDSIHSCGCYHKYFLASNSLIAKSQPTSLEPANIFELDANTIHNGLTLSITANEHYIVGVDSALPNAQPKSLLYGTRPYDLLHNLNSGGGNRSLFDDQGLITGSERLERFTLWPTGILSVGAMRQWGTHATGFIEEQHFDDADLLEQYF
ncbi:MAG: hypothetical protein JKY29_07815, partial [Gammaproteobacteria bacterium]|nr:hypothetical protein [Gammaproteobacteria bacterium]